MTMKPAKWGDKDMQVIIGNLLRGGVLLSTLIVILGGIVYLWRHGEQLPEYKTFHGQPMAFRTIPGIFQSVFEGKGRGIIQLGVLVLIATPFVRVAFSIFGYFREKDYLYMGVTLLVLGIILFSMMGGLGG
jgi:uncharacterized membrane protein